MSTIKAFVAVYSVVNLGKVFAANWVQHAGEEVQNNVIPYIPDLVYFNASGSGNAMWSARWGHAVVVANQTNPRNDFTEEENTELSNLGKPYLVLLGGDDYITDGYKSLISYTNHLSINSAGGQFRNDIWWMSPPIKTKYRWNVEGTNLHPRRNENNEPSTILSNTKWTQSNGGRIAPETWPSDHSKAVTFLDWIQCQEVFSNIRENRTSCSEPEEYCFENILNPGCKPEAVWKYNNMWSPRRGHGSIVANNKLFVIGGRAREVIDMQPSSMVGGIVESDNTIAIHELDHHAKAILKNDVWVSDDGLGKTWRLATPGCQDHQEDILLQTELWQAKYDTSAGSKLKSTIGRRCETSDDCFGAAICRNVDNVEYKTCVCPMFSPREHHTVVIQHRYRPDKGYKEDYIYVIGGFTSIRQSFCGNQVCKGQPSYRRALNDVWVSNNGIDWIQLAPASPKDGYFPPRGAHASLISYDKSAQRDQIWIFGGETSEPNDEITHYLPDVWRIDVSTDPCCMMESKCASFPQLLKIDDIGRCLPSKASFQKIKNHAIWQGRAGHTVVYEPALSRNLFQHQMYLMGGRNATTVFSDVWSWNFQLDSSWRKDFNLDQWYRSMDNGKLHFGPSTTHSPISNHGTPHSLYLTGDSSLAELMEVFLPQNRTHDLSNFTREFRVPLFTDDDVQILTRNNIRTLYDLATIELYDLLRLRGFDFPGEDSTPIPRVCQALSISRAFLNKCVAGKNWNTSNGERRLSKHYSEQSNVVRMVFGDLYYATIGDKCNSIDCVLTSWDGCSTIGKEIMVDVTGIGNVPVPRTDFDPRYLIEDMHCRTVPKARYFAAAEFLDNQVVLAGGHGLQENELFRDTWARDDMFPQASISHRPRDGTKDSVFFFESNEEGAKIFEYKIMDETERLPVTTWVKADVNEMIDVSWLDHKKGGPGKGLYTLYVRSIDPSGNRDYQYTTKSNVHVWTYVPPLPWTMIILCTVSVLMFLIAAHLEYRRRKRKAALERYAIRRMRRKFKARAISNGMGNITDEEWRAIYFHSKATQRKDEKEQTNIGYSGSNNISANQDKTTESGSISVLQSNNVGLPYRKKNLYQRRRKHRRTVHPEG